MQKKKDKKLSLKFLMTNEIQKINLDFDLRPDQLNTQNFLELSKLQMIMANYAVGDIQGCYKEFEKGLKKK